MTGHSYSQLFGARPDTKSVGMAAFSIVGLCAVSAVVILSASASNPLDWAEWGPLGVLVGVLLFLVTTLYKFLRETMATHAKALEGEKTRQDAAFKAMMDELREALKKEREENSLLRAQIFKLVSGEDSEAK
jgi:hypothetical protein